MFFQLETSTALAVALVEVHLCSAAPPIESTLEVLLLFSSLVCSFALGAVLYRNVFSEVACTRLSLIIWNTSMEMHLAKRWHDLIA